MNILEQFVNEGFDELLLVVGHEPRAKKLGRWVILKNHVIMLSDWAKIINQILSEKQKSDLDVIGFVGGQFVLKQQSFQFSCLQRSDLLKVNLVKNQTSIDDIQLPARLTEYLKKTNGLTVFGGQKDSKLNVLVENCIQQMKTDVFQNILVVKNTTDMHFVKMNTQIISVQLNLNENENSQGLFDGFECVVFVQPSEKIFKSILNLVESGTKVFVVLSGKGIVNLMQKLTSYFLDDRQAQLRLIDQLDGIFYQQCYHSDCYIHEFLFMNQSLRQMIIEQNWLEIENFLSQTTDHPNLVSLNQSLIQLILKRKIDLRKSFELTRFPSQLDQMLKKVGV